MTAISNFLNKHRCANLSGVFETQTFQVCPTEPIICVKEDCYAIPKFLTELLIILILNSIINNNEKATTN
jgi:hypothetical protein